MLLGFQMRLSQSSRAASDLGFPKSLTSWREACGTVKTEDDDIFRFCLKSVVKNKFKQIISLYLFEGKRPSFCNIVSIFTSKNSTITAISLLGNLLYRDTSNIQNVNLSEYEKIQFTYTSFISFWLTVDLKLPTLHLALSSSLPFFALCSSLR